MYFKSGRWFDCLLGVLVCLSLGFSAFSAANAASGSVVYTYDALGRVATAS